MILRQATYDDVPVMVEIGLEFHKESQFSCFEFDELQVKFFIEGVIDDPMGISIVAEEGGEIIGGILGYVSHHFFGPGLEATNTATFVRREWRGSRAGWKLIKAYEAEAFAKGAEQVFLSNATDINKDSVAGLFQKAGYKHIGYVLTKNKEQ